MRLFFAICLLAVSATAQTPTSYTADSTLTQLIAQRSKLYKDWDYFQQQNHALFGGKSKNDLRDIIATLEKIVAKDNQVLARLSTINAKERERLELQALRLQTKTGDLTNQTNSFLDESNELAERVKKMDARLKAERELRKTAEAQTERTFQIATAVVLLALGLAGLVWWRGRTSRKF